jgi:uncharacterized membrane protein YphA (DoxX/SURF4 family)
VELAARLILAAVLAGAAVAKLRSPRESAAAMDTYGFQSAPARWATFALATIAEIGLAIGVAAGNDTAALAAAALMALFALTLISTLMQGRAGKPCGCFGAGSTVSWSTIARNAALAVGFAALALLS